MWFASETSPGPLELCLMQRLWRPKVMPFDSSGTGVPVIFRVLSVDGEVPECKGIEVTTFWNSDTSVKRWPIFNWPSFIFKAALCFWSLWTCPTADIIILQNPPIFPTGFIVSLICFMRKSKFVIDWHNLSYSVFRCKYPQLSWISSLLRTIESKIASLAHHHFAVTEALGQFLVRDFGIPDEKVTILHDLPESSFYNRSLEAQHEFFEKLFTQNDDFIMSYNPFTGANAQGKIESSYQRPILIVSSTSWTEDEDICGMLFDGLQIAEQKLCRFAPRLASLHPTMYFFITGKGPLREAFEEKVKLANFRFFQVRTLWLSRDDYCNLLGSADFGVSMHTSSSGLDFPMKVLDMLGSDLPVLAAKFSCIEEVFKAGEHGELFSSAEELADKILIWSKNAPKNQHLQAIREKLKADPLPTWIPHYTKIAIPALQSLAEDNKKAD